MKTGSSLDSSPWTTEEQKLLEQALKTYPVNTAERWEKIAAAVPGRSKKDCMKRYKVRLSYLLLGLLLAQVLLESSAFTFAIPPPRQYSDNHKLAEDSTLRRILLFLTQKSSRNKVFFSVSTKTGSWEEVCSLKFVLKFQHLLGDGVKSYP